MYPPLFAVLKDNTAVSALLGGDPYRVFVPGEAPEGIKLAYLTWQTIGGVPENYLGDKPDVDNFVTQLDAYAKTLTEARAVAKAVRDAVEAVAYVTQWLGENREPDTRLFRVSFQVDWITDRSIN